MVNILKLIISPIGEGTVKGAQIHYWKKKTFAVFLENNLALPIKNQIASQSIYTKETILYNSCNSKK